MVNIWGGKIVHSIDRYFERTINIKNYSIEYQDVSVQQIIDCLINFVKLISSTRYTIKSYLQHVIDAKYRPIEH